MNQSNHIRYHDLSLIGGVCADGPPPLLLEALTVPEHEDVLSGETRNSDAGKK